MDTSSNLLTAQEAAKFLRVSIHTLRGWTSKGRLPYCKLGNRKVLYPLRGLVDLVNNSMREPRPWQEAK